MSKLNVCAVAVCMLAGTAHIVAGQQSAPLQHPPNVERSFSPPDAYVPDLANLSAATSELRDTVDRFGTDRQAILRFYTVSGSRERRERLDRVGMLWWRMHRAARIIFSLNFHLGRWTPEQCIDFLVNRVGHERFTATGEVRRSFAGNYSPLYQVAYMMGGLQIRSLYKELVDPKKMTPKQFHDAVLKANSMPIEMLRALMTAQPLTRDYRAQWKYYGDVPAARQ